MFSRIFIVLHSIISNFLKHNYIETDEKITQECLFWSVSISRWGVQHRIPIHFLTVGLVLPPLIARIHFIGTHKSERVQYMYMSLSLYLHCFESVDGEQPLESPRSETFISDIFGAIEIQKLHFQAANKLSNFRKLEIFKNRKSKNAWHWKFQFLLHCIATKTSEMNVSDRGRAFRKQNLWNYIFNHQQLNCQTYKGCQSGAYKSCTLRTSATVTTLDEC